MTNGTNFSLLTHTRARASHSTAAVVNIAPFDEAPTYVNGISVNEPTELKNGNRVVLGMTHVFRFMNPDQGR